MIKPYKNPVLVTFIKFIKKIQDISAEGALMISSILLLPDTLKKFEKFIFAIKNAVRMRISPTDAVNFQQFCQSFSATGI